MSDQAESVSLTVSLTDPHVDGYKWTRALVKDDNAQKKKGASRQKKMDDKKREEGFKRDYVSIELIELSDLIGWTEIVVRAKRESMPTRRQWWKFWEIAA